MPRAAIQVVGELGRHGWLRIPSASLLLCIVIGCEGRPITSDERKITVRQSHADHHGSAQVTSLLGARLTAMAPGADREPLEANLAQARQLLVREPDDPKSIIWVGRRLGYLWRMNEAVDVYSQGIRRYPTNAALYRHRGHRYISLRQFDLAVDDLTRATELIHGRPDEIELDGMPNARNIPLTTTGFNVWYHLGLAYYLQGDFERALDAYRETMKHARGYDDNLVAVTDWTYMTLRRLGRDDEAAALLEPISADMDIIENHAYHRRLLMYKGELNPDDLLGDSASPLDLATQGYGVGNWYLCNGETDRAVVIFRRMVSGPYWPAFGYIASEVELVRLRPELRVSETAPRPQETKP